MNFGSVCSGIEAASLAFKSCGMKALWFSETAEFPSKVLEHHYPNVPNMGDMNELPNLIREGKLPVPDVLCGGTPCQAFSLAGWRQGLIDSRGQLTLKFIEVADAIDHIRMEQNKKPSIILWENVEGVLRDSTNAFGVFIAGLAGLEEEIRVEKWMRAGVLHGVKRNIAWRILDAKYFGLPQQRKRLFLLATDTHLNPEKILFEVHDRMHESMMNLDRVYDSTYINYDNTLFQDIDTHSNNHEKITMMHETKFEIFRTYTDTLYSAYGTKWNGNAAAYNGSLYVAQNNRVRRMTPLECERLMGFPDNYTNISGAKDTNRYQALGNSWAIPVVEWLGSRISNFETLVNGTKNWIEHFSPEKQTNEYKLYQFQKDFIKIDTNHTVNVSASKNQVEKGEIFEILDTNAKDKFYISPKAASGILRRKNEKNINMNEALEMLFVAQSFNSVSTSK